MNKVGLSFGPEVPFDGGGAFHLTPPFTGDTAQFEASPCHGLSVRVHFCTGSVTLVNCGEEGDGDKTFLNCNKTIYKKGDFNHKHIGSVDSGNNLNKYNISDTLLFPGRS